ncbi:MAG TPA: class I SAM-dependent methyltransferase [Vicinamibacterales bacterium]
MTPKPVTNRDHYSYAVYADPSTAETFDARRFGGPIGEIVAASQARVLLNMVGEIVGQTVLDVGTGTGRAALLLAAAGAKVTGVDASEEMLAIARQRAAQQGIELAFLAGDAHALDFGDRSFDTVVSLRVLMHTPDWRRFVAELCRVASRQIVVDYPSLSSAAAVESSIRRVTHALGSRTEPYRVFTTGEVSREFLFHGFALRAQHRQFVLPIAFHKSIGSARFTQSIEHVFERAGLLRLVGSPVTILLERCAS